MKTTDSGQTFTIGQFVINDAVPGTFTVAEGPNTRGDYRIVMGQLSLWIRGEKLRPAPGSKKEKLKRSRGNGRRDASTASEPQTKTVEKQPSGRTRKIDLHGLRAAEVEAAVVAAINDCLIAEIDCIEFVHGRGTGAVKKALDSVLNRFKQIRSFAPDPRNRGVTKAYL